MHFPEPWASPPVLRLCNLREVLNNCQSLVAHSLCLFGRESLGDTERIKIWLHLLDAHSLMGKTGAHTVKITQRRLIIESPESKEGGALRRGASFAARDDDDDFGVPNNYHWNNNNDAMKIAKVN